MTFIRLVTLLLAFSLTLPLSAEAAENSAKNSANPPCPRIVSQLPYLRCG
jgi:hypothetical protein